MKKFLKEIEDNICGLLLLAMMVLTCINVFARYVFKSSMPFVEELTALGLVIISLSGAAVAAKRGAHLGLTVFTDLLPEKVQKGCVLLGHLLGTVFGLVLLGFGISMAALEYELKLVTAGMQWPEWMMGAFVPVSGAVLTVRYMQLFIRDLKGKEEKS